MSFRRTNGILSNTTTAYVDADVIMTATILGFSVLRSTPKDSVQFDTEGLYALPDEDDKDPKVIRRKSEFKEDVIRFATIVDKVNAVLGPQKVLVKQGTSPAYGFTEKVIHGIANGDTHYPGPAVFEGVAKEIHDLALEENEDQSLNLGYRGKGAYTGFMVPPEADGLAGITCTYRNKVPTTQERWLPAKDVRLPQAGKPDLVYSIGDGDEQKAAWGLLLTNKEQKRLGTMASVPGDLVPTSSDILGYTHGLPQAIVKCIMHDDKNHGAYKPFEIAVGKETTKLASCFPCTLFMCANGYPPSSIHLGRGESWLPMYALEKGDKEFNESADTVITSTTKAWQSFCAACISAGVDVLKGAATHIAPDHVESFAALQAYISAKSGDVGWGANLILDALTIHDTETNRLDRTLCNPSR